MILFNSDSIEDCSIFSKLFLLTGSNGSKSENGFKSDDYLLEKRNLMREYIMGHKNITFDQALEKVSNY